MKRRGWRRRSMARALLRCRWPRRLAEAALPPVKGLGVRLERGLQQTETPPREPGGGGSGPPVLLEFLGPSGIGKTTLAQALLHHDDLRRAVEGHGGVLSRHEALRQSRTSPELVRADLAPVYSELSARMWSQLLGEPLPNAAKATKIIFDEERLAEEMQLQSLGSTHLVISETGMFHTFMYVLDDFFQRSPHGAAFLERRMFVHLSAPLDVVYERLRDRSWKIGWPVRHDLVPESERLGFVAFQAACADALARRMRLMGTPVFDLDVGADGLPDLTHLTSSIVEAVASMVGDDV